MGLTVTPLNAGELRFEAVFQMPAPSAEPAEGDHVDLTERENWVEFCKRRASCKSLGAKEFINPDGSIQISTTVYEVKVRYDSLTKCIIPTMRVFVDGKLLNIETAYDPDSMKRQIRITGIEETT